MQDHSLERFAAENGMIIAGKTLETAAGRSLDRAGLNTMLKATQEGKIDFVLARSRDRISRSSDLCDLFRYEALLNNCGVRVVYTTETA